MHSLESICTLETSFTLLQSDKLRFSVLEIISALISSINNAFSSVWKYVGYHTVIYLAALQDIPSSLYESAEIDGANAWQRFTRITVPLLSNTTWFLIIISIINTFQAFDQIYLMTQGGPLKTTDVIVYYIYRQAFINFDMSYASAASWILFIVVFLLTALQMKVSKRDWDY